MVSKELLAAKQFDRVTELTRQAVALAGEDRQGESVTGERVTR